MVALRRKPGRGKCSVSHSRVLQGIAGFRRSWHPVDNSDATVRAAKIGLSNRSKRRPPESTCPPLCSGAATCRTREVKVSVSTRSPLHLGRVGAPGQQVRDPLLILKDSQLSIRDCRARLQFAGRYRSRAQSMVSSRRAISGGAEKRAAPIRVPFALGSRDVTARPASSRCPVRARHQLPAYCCGGK